MTIKKAKALLDAYYELGKAHANVQKPLSWALYQVWKLANAEEKENE